MDSAEIAALSPTADDFPERLCAQLRRHSCAFVLLEDDEIRQSVARVYDSCDAFFDGEAVPPTGSDAPLGNGDPSDEAEEEDRRQQAFYDGHTHIEGVKDMVFTRVVASGDPHPPEVAKYPAFAEAVTAGYAALHTVGEAVLRAIATEAGLVDSALTDYLAGPEEYARRAEFPDDPGVRLISRTTMSVFRYEPGAAMPCEAHTDYPLITLIPAARVPGLQLMDLVPFSMRDAHEMCPDMVYDEEEGDPGPRAVAVLVGETLEYLLSDKLLATMHGVRTGFETRRYSCPLLIYAGRDAMLDPPQLARNTPDGSLAAAFESSRVNDPINAQDLLSRLQASKQSVNYDTKDG